MGTARSRYNAVIEYARAQYNTAEPAKENTTGATPAKNTAKRCWCIAQCSDRL